MGATDPAFLQLIGPALLADAQVCIRSGRCGSSVDIFNRYTGAVPDDPEAFYLLGQLQQHREPDAPRKAESYFQKAIELKPDFAAAHLALGMIEYKAGEWALACSHFELGLALDPENRENLYYRTYLQRCRQKIAT